MKLTSYAEGVDPSILAVVKQYILNASRFDYATWPTGNSYQCLIWKDGVPNRVGSGANWTMTSSIIYIDSNPAANVPNWAPAALKCVAGWFGLNNDPEVIEAIDTMTEEIRFRIKDAVERATASSRRGRPVRRIAIHNTEGWEAGYYNVAGEGEEERMEWRDHEGNTLDINDADPNIVVMDW